MRSCCTELRSPLGSYIQSFLKYKRALGCDFSTEESALVLLDTYLEKRDLRRLDQIDPPMVDAFLASRPRKRPRSFNHLLGVVRRFFVWMVVQGYIESSPVATRPRRQTSTRIPFLFSPQQAQKLLQVAKEFPDNNRAPLRGPTYYLLFALMYGLGLRVGEASRLTHEDVDATRDLLVIRDAKFGKARLVPFGPKMAARLRWYCGLKSGTGPLFSFTTRGPVHPCTVSQTFHQTWPKLGLTVPPGVSAPTVHCLRHSFAVETLLRWYRQGIDPQRRLLQLSTFLGHAAPSSTAVYLTITEQLLQAANERFEEFACAAIIDTEGEQEERT